MKIYKSKIDKISLVRESADVFKAKIVRSDDAVRYVRDFYPDDMNIREHFYALYMNHANNTVGYQHISMGGIAGTLVDIKFILKGALDTMATGLILVHNHPSGNLRPSKSDDTITTKVGDACKLIDVRLLDHLILTEDSFYSYADNGKL